MNERSNETLIKTHSIFDDQFLLNQLSGNSDLVISILRKFVVSMKKQVKNIHTAIEEKDIEEVIATGHKLKGAAVTIGCNQLSEIAAEIEMAGVENNIKKAEVILPQLQPCYILTIKAIQGGIIEMENH